MALTTQDIIDQATNEIGFLRKYSVDIDDYPIETIKWTLESGEDVLISGFGKFCVKDKNERKGRNPATGETAILPARRVVTFKWSKKLREKINGE